MPRNSGVRANKNITAYKVNGNVCGGKIFLKNAKGMRNTEGRAGERLG